MVTPRVAILLCCDDPAVVEQVELELAGTATLRPAGSWAAAIESLRADPAGAPDVAIAVDGLAGEPAARMAPHLLSVLPELGILVLAADPGASALVMAVHARQVVQALPLPFRSGELLSAVLRAAEVSRLRRDLVGLRQRMQRRIDTLTLLGELAAATAELGSCEEVAAALPRLLYRIVRYDLAAAAIVMPDASASVLHLHCREPADDTVLQATRDRCLETLRSLAGIPIDESNFAISVSGERPGSRGSGFGIGSSTHVPIMVDGKLAGLLFLVQGEGRSATFSTDDEQLLYFLTSRVAEAIRRLLLRRHDERRRLSRMVECMADGLIMTDRSHSQVLINPAARRLLGIDADTVVTTHYLKSNLGFYPFDLVSSRPASQEQPVSEELRIAGRTLHSTVSPIRDSSGQLSGVVVVLRDFTQVRDLARRQEEFVSVVSHELRTPLTSITGALDIVLGEYAGRLGEKQRRYLQMARDSCARLNLVVDDLLDAARSERGHMPVHFAPLALDELAREAADRYRAEMQAKKIRLQLKIEGDSIRIIGDPDRLTQVLNNLLSNAIKFTPPGGLVEVEIFGPSVASSHVGVSVYNDGEPVPEEARERIFEKFEQLERTSTRKVGGTGLGLAISRAIIEAHGGRIWVEARSEGTRFVFTLPTAPELGAAAGDDGEATAATPAPGSPPAQSLPPADRLARVLVVDDDLHSTSILKGILMAAGHTVLVARDADETLTLARANRPELAVINADMRSAPALALTAIFKHDPDTRKTALLVVTRPEARDEVLRSGADEVVSRPIDPVRFRELCTALLDAAGQEQAQKILIVDDDEAIRTICRDVLEGSGYAVREAADGMSALAEARRFRPDLLLLDVMMPLMDGFRTAERFRADPATALTPIIFLSAKGETADKVRAFRIGAEDYVVKPFDAVELVARVKKALVRRERELGASPTTQLPGSGAIEAEIERRLAEGGHAFCYLDLDNLKAFNDYYGYAKADGVIRQTGDIVREAVAREGREGDFIGHIAGDDFVFITRAETVDRVCTTICATFDRLVPLYYNKVDRERGYIETTDRYGVMRKFPLMSVSLAAVTSRGGHPASYSELASAAARGKELAKSLAGSSYVRDGQILLGRRAEADTTVPVRRVDASPSSPPK
jgi:PAS domain S-box-containing protein